MSWDVHSVRNASCTVHVTLQCLHRCPSNPTLYVDNNLPNMSGANQQAMNKLPCQSIIGLVTWAAIDNGYATALDATARLSEMTSLHPPSSNTRPPGDAYILSLPTIQIFSSASIPSYWTPNTPSPIPKRILPSSI